MARSSGVSRSQARVRQARTGSSWPREQEKEAHEPQSEITRGHSELVDGEGWMQEADGVGWGLVFPSHREGCGLRASAGCRLDGIVIFQRNIQV